MGEIQRQERTGRSRGTYLRMALWSALPKLEKIHWDHVAADYEPLAIKDASEEITLGFMEQALQEDRERDKKTNQLVLGRSLIGGHLAAALFAAAIPSA